MALNWGDIQELRSRVPREYAPWGEPRSLEPGYVRNLGVERALDDLPPPDPDAPDADQPGESIEAAARAIVFDTGNTRVAMTASRPLDNIVGTAPAPDAQATVPKPPIFAAIPQAPAQQAVSDSATAIGKTDTRAREIGLSQFNLGTGFNDPETDAPNFILSGAAASRRDADLARVQEKRKDDDRSAFDRARQALEDRLRALDAELAAIRKELGEVRERRTEIADSTEAVDELETLARSGKLDPSNPAHAKLLRRAGISKEDAQRSDFIDILERRRGELATEDGGLQRREGELERREGEVSRERDRTQRQADELDARARAGTLTPGIADRLAAQAKTQEGARELGNTAFRAETAEAKAAIVDAGARNVGAAAREANADFGREGINQIAAVTRTAGNEFNFDAPPSSGTSAASAVEPTPIKAAALTPTFTTASDPAAQPVQSAANDVEAALIRSPTSPGIKAG